MSVFYPGQSVRISDLVSVALVLRVRSIEGNVLELEACDGSFYGFRHASSVTPVCTSPAETSVPPLGAGLVAQPSVGGGGCIRRKRYRQVVVAVTNHDDVAQLYRRSYEAAFESEMARRAVEFFS